MDEPKRHSSPKKATFYKYKTVKDFIYFTDIVLNNRLFAPYYPDLNDPMEGHYYYEPNELPDDVRQLIRREKNSLRVCCLSAKGNDPLMWAHYADGNRGVVIEVEICGEQPVRINYRKELFNYRAIEGREPNEIAKEILSHKLKAWSYEKEYRAFSNESSYILVRLKKVVLGSRMPCNQKKLIKALVRRVNAVVVTESSDVGVIQRQF